MKKIVALLLAILLMLSTVTAFAEVYKDKPTVKAVQQALNDAGYNCGAPDGSAGKKTKAAVTQFQTDKGLEVTGQIDDALLEALGVAEEPATEATDAADAATTDLLEEPTQKGNAEEEADSDVPFSEKIKDPAQFVELLPLYMMQNLMDMGLTSEQASVVVSQKYFPFTETYNGSGSDDIRYKTKGNVVLDFSYFKDGDSFRVSPSIGLNINCSEKGAVLQPDDYIAVMAFFYFVYEEYGLVDMYQKEIVDAFPLEEDGTVNLENMGEPDDIIVLHESDPEIGLSFPEDTDEYPMSFYAFDNDVYNELAGES